jgi:hypothetical protein
LASTLHPAIMRGGRIRMAYLHFAFETAGFVDPPQVREQSPNGIEGRALALRLAGALSARGVAASQPWAEDHGWDFSVAHGGAKYLCACSLERGEGAAAGAVGDAHVTLHKARGMLDSLLGRGRFDPRQDAVAVAVRAAVREAAGEGAVTEDFSA